MKHNPYTKRFRYELTRDWSRLLECALTVKSLDKNKKLHAKNFCALLANLNIQPKLRSLHSEVTQEWTMFIRIVVGLQAIIEKWLEEEESLLPDNQPVCAFMVSLWKDLVVLQFIFEQQEQTISFADVVGWVEPPQALLARFPSLFPEC